MVQIGFKFSEESKRRMSESHKKNPTRYWLGKSIPLETREKIRKKLAGTKQSQEVINKARLSRIGYRHSEETKKKISQSNIGRIISDDAIRKISISLTGKKQSIETREKRKKSLIGRIGTWEGKKFSREHIQKIRDTLRKSSKRGYLSHSWRGGLTGTNDILRRNSYYKEWRTKVFERDNFTCQWCRIHGGRLNADHIKPFSLFPELRYDINNGRTLCIDCHKETESYGNKKVFQLELGV